jgi:hypothetical protein
MAARLTINRRYRGVVVYNSAATHPGSITRCLVVWHEDLGLGGAGQERFRYRVGDVVDYTRASCEVARYINKHVAGDGKINAHNIL